MTRGGRAKLREEPERRCIATGETGPKEGLIRFVIGPEGHVVPDLAGRLPGRGVWVAARRDCLDLAVRRKLFARAARGAATAPEGLADTVEGLLAARLIKAIGLARKAGLAVAGFEKVKARLKQGGVAVLLEASDAAADGKDKLAALAGEAIVVDCLSRGEMGLAFGRDFVVHAALEAGGATDRVAIEARRLAGFRPQQAGVDAAHG